MKNIFFIVVLCCSSSFLNAQESVTEKVNKNSLSANPIPLLALIDLKTANPSIFFEYKRKVKKGYFRVAVQSRQVIEDVNYNLYGAPQTIAVSDSAMKIGFLKNQTTQYMLRIGKEKQFFISASPKWYAKGSYDFIIGKKTVSEFKLNKFYKKVSGTYILQSPTQSGLDDYTGNTVIKDYFNVGVSIGTGLGYKFNKHFDLSLNAFFNLLYSKSSISNVKNTSDLNINLVPTFSFLF